MRVLVTGSTGFVGHAVCQLLLDSGHDVTAVVRELPAEVVPGCDSVAVGSIHGETEWRHALDNVDAVVHLAARTHQDDGADAIKVYQTVNVDGTAQLARSALTAGVGTFTYMSSVKVNGEYSPVDENGLPRPFSGEDEPRPVSLYGHTKWQAEQLLNKITSGIPMRLVILRPPLVYGPGQKGNLFRLMRAIDRGVPLPFAGLNNCRSLIDVKNLASAVVLTVAPNCAAVGPYTLADIEVSTAELVRETAIALGSRPRLFRFPVPLLAAAARLTGRRDQLDKLTQSLVVDSTRITAATSWVPERSLEASLRETVVHYRADQANL